MNVILENGFKVATSDNIPAVTSEMIFTYITRLAHAGASPGSDSGVDDYTVDCVQIRRRGICLVKGRIWVADSEEKNKNNVALLINEKQHEVVSAMCEECSENEGGNFLIDNAVVTEITNGSSPGSCLHGIAFLFWIYRKSMEGGGSTHVTSFWASETDDELDVTQIKDLYYPEPVEVLDESDVVTDETGEEFLNDILEQMEKTLLTDSPFYRHCKPVVEEFEPVYIHHTMLDVSRYKVTNYKTFLFHMESICKKGLFDRIQQESVSNYKSRLWMETQYCRIRCSLVYKIVTRKDPSEDEEILNSIFGTDRESRALSKQQLKSNKRQMLKQTVKLHNKDYEECGLLLCPSYPYLCASPDAVGDDFIIEIKSPKTEEEFEQYLEGSGTISPKYMAQIQLQMYIANVSKALYCVLSPSFETTGALHFVWIAADTQQAYSFISVIEDYWKNIVFPRIASIYGEE